MDAGYRNLTVFSTACGDAGQVLTGKRNKGWYCGQDNVPVFLHPLNTIQETSSPDPSLSNHQNSFFPHHYISHKIKHPQHVNVRNCINGPIFRVIDGISTSCPAYILAFKLIKAGERDFTVLCRSNSRAGQILTGRHMEGWYCGKGNVPEYLKTPQGENIDTGAPMPGRRSRRF